ncbi:MAG: inositol monophosphatase family protein [Planctomycetales bacterium]|nr:inositol monophosphatase family protein [Planctomycetales bacterium]
MAAALPVGVLPQDLSSRLELAVSAGKEAGRLTLTYFQQDNYSVERKADASPVTIADRSAEELLRRRIAAAFPADAIIGEEFGRSEGTSGITWILDPIDGTKSFISGVPLYGTMVGIEHGGRSLVGFVYIPGLDEGVYASLGEGAWHFRGVEPPKRATVSKRPLNQGLFVTSQVDSFAKRGAMDVFHGLEKVAYVTRTWGDCYGYLLVATGRAELMVDPILNVWDAAAVQPIVEEAGGTFTDWQGNPTIHAGEAIATNGLELEKVLGITKQSKQRSPLAP